MSLKENFNHFINQYEFRRKAIHFLIGIAFVAFINLNHYLIKEQMEVMLLIALIISIALSVYIKYKKPKHILDFLKLFDKPKDLENFPAKGVVFYLIGVLVAIAFFERNVASAAIVILAVGDPAAHIVGRYYGKRKLIVNPKKLLEGTLAGTLFGTIAASVFVPWPIAFFGAAFGMMSEAFELEYLHLDDNFFIPFVSGLVITLIEALI